MTTARAPSRVEAAVVVAITFGWFIVSSLDAVAQGFPTTGSFSDASLVTLMAIECVLGGLALLFLRLRGYPLESLRPVPTVRGCVLGVGLYFAALVAWWLLDQFLPNDLLAHQPIEEIARHARPSMLIAIALSLLNGAYEETFVLGYLVRHFESAGASFAIGLSVLVRVLYHLYQGPVGAVSMLVYGVLVGLFYWRTRTLWPVIFAHALTDVIALT